MSQAEVSPREPLDASLLPVWDAVLSFIGHRPFSHSPSTHANSNIAIVEVAASGEGGAKSTQDAGDRLLSLARLARIRIRRVAFSSGWWERDTGPLIGFLKDGRAVALLPRWAGGYDLIDAARGTRRRMSAEVAETLASFGYLPYRTLPDRRLTLRDIVAFCGQHVWRDLAFVLLLGIALSMAGAALAVASELLMDIVLPSGDPKIGRAHV